MKKSNNKVTRFAIIVLALTMVALILVSGTYAKYISTATGSDTATVAKWDVKVNDTQIAHATAQTFEFDLFDTIKDTNFATEENVSTGKIIAPGTSGEFNINVLNESQVDANIAISLTKTQAGVGGTVTNGATPTAGTVPVPDIPLEYKLISVNTETSAETVLSDWSATLPTITDEVLDKEDGEKEIKIQWRWLYQVQDAGSDPATYATRDASDTILGIAARENATAPSITITATVTATQID